MKEYPERNFKRERDLDLCRDSHPKKVAVLNLPVTHLDLELIWSIPLRLSDPRSLLDWVLHHQVLPSKVEQHLKDVPTISSFIQEFAVCLREYVFILIKLVMLRNTTHS